MIDLIFGTLVGVAILATLIGVVIIGAVLWREP